MGGAGLALFLKWTLPLEIFFIGKDKFDLSSPLSFRFKGMQCNIAFKNKFEKFVEKESDSDSYFFIVAEFVTFSLEEDSAEQKIKIPSIIKVEDLLLKTLLKITNRFIKNMRVFGFIPDVHEIIINENGKSYLLNSLNPSTSDDNVNWQALRDARSIKNNLVATITGRSSTFITMDMKYWDSVQDGIINDLTPPTEIELAVNAIENLRSQNLRLAILESVIGLEITLTSFLREYLKRRRGFDDNKVNEFLSPEFGLSARLSGLLDLTIEPKDLKKIDLDKVKNVVSWRNKIVHRTGNIPDGVSNQQIIEGTDAVLQLIFLLYNKKNLVIKFPDPLILGDFTRYLA